MMAAREPTSTGTNEAEEDESPEVLRRTDQIYNVLRALCNHQSQVHVQFPAQHHEFVSMVLRVDLEEQVYILDEFVPAEGHRLAGTREPFHVRARFQGAEIAIRNVVADKIGEEDGVAFYALPFPERMIYIQRRDAFRVDVLPGSHANIELRGERFPKPARGELLDLSGTGCRFKLPEPPNPPLNYREHVEECVIEFPGHDPIVVEGEIRFVKILKESGETVCGLHFVKLRGRQERQVFRLVNELQRDARQLELSADT